MNTHLNCATGAYRPSRLLSPSNRGAQFVALLLPLLLAVSLSACGGGGSDGGGPTPTKTFSADGEARRIAVLYRPLRDLSAVLLPYAVPGAQLKALGGTTRSCSLGGTATYSYTPGPVSPGTEQTLQAQFSNCTESLGVIQGSITIKWNNADDNTSAGTFTPTWYGTVTVAGVTYGAEVVAARSGGITLSYNATSGYRDVLIRVRTMAGLQGPSGPTLDINIGSWHLIDDPSASTLQLTDITSNVENASGPIGSWRSPGAVTVARTTSSAAVGGVGFPMQGGFTYARNLRSGGRESLTGDGQINSGLLNLSVRGSQSQLTDAGQYTWADLLSRALYDMDGE
ncbi:MAG: hypothetical protein EPN60_17215 [Nevskiaceae bacterium]|nr:MAG: hypothetical protein EPO48_11050 [Nevskiaceae bacterium]TAM22252.1 MAG: hypothetical protein EPN60_17215 [Nevskiaceae bacterium]